MGLSNSIPSLKEEIPHGVHECVISDVKSLKDSNGMPITYLGSACVIFSFNCDGKISEKLFRLGDQFDYSSFKKLIAIIGVKNDIAFNIKDVVGKKVCVIIYKITSKDGESRLTITNFKSIGKNYKHLKTEIYE